MPRFFIVGTKYDRTQDMFPDMEKYGVVATGFAGKTNLSHLIELDSVTIRKELDKLIPTETGHAKSTLTRFLSMKPGDIVALKSHSAPYKGQARLVIARYAVILGDKLPKYRSIENLGHCLVVEFLAEQELIEYPYAYGKTVHEITKNKHIAHIFGELQNAAIEAEKKNLEPSDKPTHPSNIESRGAYIMNRVHNELQNELRKYLLTIHPNDTVKQETNYIDLSISLPEKFILIEVKSSKSPSTCIREAIGQMFYYASQRTPREMEKIEYLVVGPNEMNQFDKNYLEFIQKTTLQNINYIAPKQYMDYQKLSS